MTKFNEHRRKASRHPLEWKAAIVFDSTQGRTTVHTQTLDLSVGGAAVFSDHGDLTGTTVSLLLAQPARKAGEAPQVLKVRARVVSTQRAPGMAQYRHGLSFIRSPGDGLEAILAWMGQASAPAPERVAPSSLGRLARLKKLAETVAAEVPAVDPQESLNAAVSEALGKAYRYLKEFAEHVGVLHPAFPRGYGIAGVPEFKGLVWSSGYADFHMREISPTVRVNERVTLRFQLSGKQQIRVDREYPAAEKLQRLLEDSGIEFHAHGVWNKKGSLERTTFEFACEVTGNLLLQGQFDTGKLLLRTRNVSGFGSLEHILAPEAITEDSLDELAAFILGETGALGPLLLRGSSE